MDQNQTVDNDLQKAIDNITNTTNTDPVFSDPVAAPSSVPEGDTGELSEPVGPFPEPKIEMVTPSPEPIAPFEPIDIPELNVPNATSSTNPEAAPVVAPEPAPVIPDSAAPEAAPVVAPEPAPVIPDSAAPEAAPVVAPKPITLEPIPTPPVAPTTNLNTRQIKEAALRDLIPLLDHTNMAPSQKFNICRNIFEDFRDYTVLEQAYRAASEITNETERAEALLYLVESIDKM